MSSGFPYRESLLHWVWGNLEFDCRSLETECGKAVSIIEPGNLNTGKGPDFQNARIRIGELLFAGHVEIHADESEWNSHQHQHDPAYNNVVLHVIYDRPASQPVLRFDNTGIPVLRLRPYLEKPLNTLLAGSRAGELPCAKHIHFINQQAFEKQLKAVHLGYLEYKTEELLKFYDPSLPVSAAWKKCLLAGIYHTLGIPGNRDSMIRLFHDTYSDFSKFRNSANATDFLFQTAFSDPGKNRYHWNEHGQRPASKPKTRVRQAAALHYIINTLPFNIFQKLGTGAWHEHITKESLSELPGAATMKLIYQTLFLPSIWLLGNLLHSARLKNDAIGEWNQTPQKVPSSILKPFIEAGFSLPPELKMSGLAHQYKRYCKPGNCQSCIVFKSAIRS